MTVAGIAVAALLIGGCRPELSATERAIGERALAEASALIAAHPTRISGENSREAAGWIAGRLPPAAELMPFDAAPGKLVNVVYRAAEKPVAILASHFDTKADIPNFIGANDGASTTGLLIALAHLTDLPVIYLFLDGEESRVDYSATDGLHGSWHVARTQTQWKHLPVIVLDMLGDRDFTPALASNGTPALNRTLRQAAAKRGHALPSAGSIIDDHVPFWAEGWQAADVIDFDFGPGNSWWHTPEDSLDKLSATSLAHAAAIVVQTINDLEKDAK